MLQWISGFETFEIKIIVKKLIEVWQLELFASTSGSVLFGVHVTLQATTGSVMKKKIAFCHSYILCQMI